MVAGGGAADRKLSDVCAIYEERSLGARAVDGERDEEAVADAEKITLTQGATPQRKTQNYH